MRESLAVLRGNDTRQGSGAEHARNEERGAKRLHRFPRLRGKMPKADGGERSESVKLLRRFVVVEPKISSEAHNAHAPNETIGHDQRHQQLLDQPELHRLATTKNKKGAIARALFLKSMFAIGRDGRI